MSLTNAQTDLVLEALEDGATVAEAAALAKLDERAGGGVADL